MRETVRRSLSCRPMIWAALPLMAAVVAADGWYAAGGAVCAVLIMLVWWLAGWRMAAGFAALAVVAGGLHGWRLAGQARMAREGIAGPATVRLEGRVTGEPEAAGGGWTALVQVTGSEGGAQPVRGLVWWEGRGPLPLEGSVVAARGRLVAPQRARNPGAFDMAGWLHRKGTDLTFEARAGSQTVRSGWLARTGAQVREAFRTAVAVGLPEDSREVRVIRAMVLGDMPKGDDELIGAFRLSGTLHIFAVSGQQVTMIGVFGWFVLGWCRVPRRVAALLLIPAGFGYAWVTGMSPSAVRAAWMAAVFLGALLLRRRPDMLNTLGVVLVGSLLWDGHLVFQAGAQLSYGVVAVIAAFAGACNRLAARVVPGETYLPHAQTGRVRGWWLRMRRSVVATFGISGAAWTGSAPLCGYHFGMIAPASVVATPVLVPLVFWLLSLSLVAVALWPVAPGAAAALNRVNGLLARASYNIADGFARIPGGHFPVGVIGDSGPRLIVYDLPFGGGAACYAYGDAGLLIDTGDRPGFRRVVLPSLRRLGISPDSVAISHPEGGHFGAGAEVFDALPVRQLLLPVAEARSRTLRSWKDGARNAGATAYLAQRGETLPLAGGAALEVVFAPDPATRLARADERVAVYRLHCRGWRVLFTNDAGYAAEQAMLRSGVDLSSDVIVAGRSRIDSSLGPAFLDAVGARALVSTYAAFPPQENIPSALRDDLARRGVPLFDQGKSGGVTLRFGEDVLEISGFLDHRILRLPKQAGDRK